MNLNQSDSNGETKSKLARPEKVTIKWLLNNILILVIGFFIILGA